MAMLTCTVSIQYRHRWLGLAFMAVCAIPADLLGLTLSEKTTDRLAQIAWRLMGPKTVVA